MAVNQVGHGLPTAVCFEPLERRTMYSASFAPSADPKSVSAGRAVDGELPSDITAEIRIRTDSGATSDDDFTAADVHADLTGTEETAFGIETYCASAQNDSWESFFQIDDGPEVAGTFNGGRFCSTFSTGVHTLRLRAVTADGESTSSSVVITIKNSAPSLDLYSNTGAHQLSVRTGELVNLYTGPANGAVRIDSPEDMSAGITYRVDWDGDDQVDEIITKASRDPATAMGPTLSHVFAIAGTFVVHVTAVDPTGDESNVAVFQVDVVGEGDDGASSMDPASHNGAALHLAEQAGTSGTTDDGHELQHRDSETKAVVLPASLGVPVSHEPARPAFESFSLLADGQDDLLNL